jgi:hypothetical protein
VHDVETAEFALGPCDEGLDVLLLRDVAELTDDIRARETDRLVEPRLVDVVRDDVRALGGERDRRGAPEARARAGDDCDLSREATQPCITCATAASTSSSDGRTSRSSVAA